jgi:hypothetical protein
MPAVDCGDACRKPPYMAALRYARDRGLNYSAHYWLADIRSGQAAPHPPDNPPPPGQIRPESKLDPQAAHCLGVFFRLE